MYSLERTIELDHDDIAKLHKRIAAVSKIASQMDHHLMLFIMLFAEIEQLRARIIIMNKELQAS